MNYINYNILLEAVIGSKLAKPYHIDHISSDNFIIHSIDCEYNKSNYISTIYIDAYSLENNCIDWIMDGAFVTFIGTHAYINNRSMIDIAAPDSISRLSAELDAIISDQLLILQRLKYY